MVTPLSPSFAAFWESSVEQLADDYVDAEGQKANCSTIAYTVGRKLGELGISSSILYLQSPDTTAASELFSSTLIPLPYGGRKVWLYHVVCRGENALIYDPILPKPAFFRPYAKEAFGLDALTIVREQLWQPVER